MSEDLLIERIVRALRDKATSASTLRLGVGDDAAVLAARPNCDWVLSSDAFLEGVHFWGDTHPAHSVGYKALARATSDLAAMGATPRFYLLTLALPPRQVGRWLDQFLSGLKQAASLFKMTLLGGDTTRNPKVFISITVIGETARGRAVRRAGARPGDLIYVTGVLGAAELGLRLLKNSSRRAMEKSVPLKTHLYPEIEVHWGRWLAQNRLASAMIDVSDGLSTDLGRLCAASGVGARLRADQIPCVSIAGEKLPRSTPNPLELALDGGEDYRLLFTVRPHNLRRLGRAPRFAELSEIGQIVSHRQVTLVRADGSEQRLVPSGWDPFRSK
jgi:thiamine-monophosphate kinase